MGEAHISMVTDPEDPSKRLLSATPKVVSIASFNFLVSLVTPCAPAILTAVL
jgi:hypothetical protein